MFFLLRSMGIGYFASILPIGVAAATEVMMQLESGDRHNRVSIRNMALEEVTGWTKEEKYQRRHTYLQVDTDRTEEDFENAFCLVEITNQPPDYDGPTRYCGQAVPKDDETGERARFCMNHGGWVEGAPIEVPMAANDNDGTEAIKHGMYAEDANLKKDFSEADEKLYNLIMGWADREGWTEEDPEYMLLEDFALSKVREMRAEKYLNEHGEVVEREEFIAELGKLNTYEETHPLVNDLRLKKKTILDMMKELGFTPKSASQMDSSETEAAGIKQIAEVAEEAISGDENEYDPEQFED